MKAKCAQPRITPGETLNVNEGSSFLTAAPRSEAGGWRGGGVGGRARNEGERRAGEDRKGEEQEKELNNPSRKRKEERRRVWRGASRGEGCPLAASL